MRLIGSIGCAYATYVVLLMSLDWLSEIFERGTWSYEFSELIFGILAPMNFGFLILFLFALVFYWFLSLWLKYFRSL